MTKKKYPYRLGANLFCTGGFKCHRFDCRYHPSEYGHNGCDFLMLTGQRRGCPAGKNCTRYSSKRLRRNCIDWTNFKPSYEQGLTDREIAEIIGCAVSVVGNYRRHLGLPANNGRMKNA